MAVLAAVLVGELLPLAGLAARALLVRATMAATVPLLARSVVLVVAVLVLLVPTLRRALTGVLVGRQCRLRSLGRPSITAAVAAAAARTISPQVEGSLAVAAATAVVLTAATVRRGQQTVVAVAAVVLAAPTCWVATAVPAS